MIGEYDERLIHGSQFCLVAIELVIDQARFVNKLAEKLEPEIRDVESFKRSQATIEKLELLRGRVAESVRKFEQASGGKPQD